MAISDQSRSSRCCRPEAGGVAPELVLQPGSVVNAQVLKVLSADLVRIAIASLSIDVESEIPLQQGQTLQLAVSQTEGRHPPRHGRAGRRCRRRSADAVTLSPDALADAAINRPASRATEERADAAGDARPSRSPRKPRPPKQDSLAPLFANLGGVAVSASAAAETAAAIAQVLAQQTSLDPNLDGGDIKTAFQKSGLFLEASLAAGSVPASGVPDLKAALIVLRQTLQSALGATRRPQLRPRRQAHRSRCATGQRREPGSRLCRPELESQEILLPQARLAGRGRSRAGRPGRPQSACGGARTPDLRPRRR